MDEIKRLSEAVKYLQAALSYQGGSMVGEANKIGGLDFYKWKLTIEQVIGNSNRIVQGLDPLPLTKPSTNDVLGRTNSVKGIFTEK